MFKSKEKAVLTCYNKHLFLAFFQMVMCLPFQTKSKCRKTTKVLPTWRSFKPELNPVDALMSASVTYSPLTSDVSNNFCDMYPETSPVIADELPVDFV